MNKYYFFYKDKAFVQYITEGYIFDMFTVNFKAHTIRTLRKPERNFWIVGKVSYGGEDD